MSAPSFALKAYQAKSLKALRAYLEKTAELNDAGQAFNAMTGRSFVQAPGLPGLPYVCLRVPTGGGKTIMAAHAIGVAADSLLRTDAPTVLWFVPSQIIRDQTLASLQDRGNPNRRALAERFGENVRILGVTDALYARRADYDGGAVVIVATIQAFRVDETEGRKVYEANGELMDHFSSVPDAVRAVLEPGPGGEPVASLANVLRLHRPMVIVDEAHNARTELSFETLVRLRPSLVVEFTATPVTPQEHNPIKGIYGSNILYHVSAAELKAEDMIKLPIVLRGRPDPQETIAEAISWLDSLCDVAVAEERETGEFVRPVMLLQAEPKSKDRPTIHPEELKKRLMADFHVPEKHIALATGSDREIDGVDLFDRECGIRFIITQQALREGWDCSFAYVLCSVAEQKSARAVEQLLGRTLRLPRARRKRHEELNRAYAFATTNSFQHAANTLREGLVNNGFERVEAESLVQAAAESLPGLGEDRAAYVAHEPIPAGVDAAAFKLNVEGALGGRVEVDIESGQLKARGALTDYDKTALLLAMPEAAGPAVEALVHKSRGARLKPAEPGRAPIRFAVPGLCVRRGASLELFDRTHFLDIPWKLEECDADLILDFFAAPKAAGDEAHVDVDTAGQVTLRFVEDLHQQLSLALVEKGWSRPALINWVDRRLPSSKRRDITRLSSTLFISEALGAIERAHGYDLTGLARAKFRVVDAVLRVIDRYRDAREAGAFARALIPQGGLEFQTSAEFEIVFDESRYGYRQPYSGGTTFRKHLFRVVGDLESGGEEFDCAVYLDNLKQVVAWVRNTSQQPHSFWLQTSSDKFYPDFIALLNDGRYIAIEYKGAHLASGDDAREKLLIGELWADRSDGHALFLMIEDRQFIPAVLEIDRRPHSGSD